MNDPGKDPWAHFDVYHQVTELCQDDTWALPKQSELGASALPPPGVEEPNLHPQRALTHLAPAVVPALHLYACQIELVARKGMDSLYAFLQVMCVTFCYGGLLECSGTRLHSRSMGVRKLMVSLSPAMAL